MLLQRLDMNSDSNMSSSGNEFDSKIFPFGNDDSKQNNDISISPLVGPFTTSSDNRTIPALPNLIAPSSSTSWSSTSGIYSLFSSSVSSSSLADKHAQQNPYPFIPQPKPQPQQQPQNHHIHHAQPKSYHGGMHPNSMEMLNPQMQVPQQNADPLETVLGVFPCVRIRGLPFEASLEDVLVLLRGLVVLDVVVVPHSYHQHGTGGEAFVVFGNPMDFQMALQRNRLNIGHQFVEIYQGKRADYYAAVSLAQQQYNPHRVDETGKGEIMQETHQGNVWSASGVHATPSQVLRTPLMQDPTKNAGKQPGGMQHPGYSKGAPSGGRAGRGSGDNNRQKGAGRGSGRGGGIQVGEHTGFLRMRGLPFTATKGEIFEFFKRYEPVEDSICLTFRSDGRATGEGYIAFGKADDAKTAMALHRNTMGNRYIELFISNKEEHGRALAREAMTPLR